MLPKGGKKRFSREKVGERVEAIEFDVELKFDALFGEFEFVGICWKQKMEICC